MAGKSEGIRVQIYDQDYMLRADGDEQHTREVARSVDEIMRTISEKTRTYDSLRLAVLAALHFADECARLHGQKEDLEEAVSEKAARCSEVLDGFIGRAG